MEGIYEIRGMNQRFSGTDCLGMKLRWANMRLREFNAVVSARRTQQYTITRWDDRSCGRHLVRCLSNPVPWDIGLILAGFVYALRSGLDQLAWHLALLGNPNPNSDVIFPIHSERTPRSEELFRECVRDMPCEAVAVIGDLQPYNREPSPEGDPLWQLNELSKIGKYRVPVIRALYGAFTIEPPGWTVDYLDYGIELSWPLSDKESVKFEPRSTQFAIGDQIDYSNSVSLKLTEFEIAEIYRYIREDVFPRFTRFFRPAPHI